VIAAADEKPVAVLPASTRAELRKIFCDAIDHPQAIDGGGVKAKAK
jgi:hypothetical protein